MKLIILAILATLVYLPAWGQLQLPDDINKPIAPSGSPVLNTIGSGNQPAQQQWTMQNFGRELARQTRETDLLDNPEKLMRLANFAAAYGVADQLPPFAALAQKAKRRAKIKTFQSLMLGNVDSAIDAAKLSGSPFADRPVKVKPNDPDDFAWEILQEGGVEAVVNVRTMFELYSQLAQSESVSLAYESTAADERQATERDRQERKQFTDEQRAFMRNQGIRNDLQIMQMLGPQPDQGLGYRGY